MNWIVRKAVVHYLNKFLEGLSMNALQGYRTYIIAGLIGLVTAGYHLGYIDSITYQTLLGVLGAGGLATLRAGINK